MNSLLPKFSTITVLWYASVSLTVLSIDFWLANMPPFLQADLCIAVRDYKGAEQWLRKDLEKIRLESSDYKSDIEYWVSECNLAILLRKQGRLLEAEELLKEALLISKRTNTPGYYVVPNTYWYMADLYRDEQRIDDEERACRTALALETEYARKNPSHSYLNCPRLSFVEEVNRLPAVATGFLIRLIQQPASKSRD